jgi:hypothetical protein
MQEDLLTSYICHVAQLMPVMSEFTRHKTVDPEAGWEKAWMKSQ